MNKIISFRRFFLLLHSLLIIPNILIAQNPPDNSVTNDSTASRELEEVTVQANRSYMSNDKLTFIPTHQQRNSATDGTMLLQSLAIPQLKVNMMTGSVTTLSGDNVSFFIDGVPATSADISDMNTRDVSRVEVLDYPIDPRFRNAKHVVNYIMRKYEYGGYTKLSNTEMLLSCFFTFNTVNSKMVYKRMTYDIRTYYQYTDADHSGTALRQLFLLPGYSDAAPEGIMRETSVGESKLTRHNPSASFRAMYQSDKTQFSTILDWIFHSKRNNSSIGSISYSPQLWNPEFQFIDNPQRSNTIKWSCDFFQLLPDNWSLSANFQLGYDHNNNFQLRKEGDVKFRDFTAKENIISTQGQIMASKSLNHRHSISVSASLYTYDSDITYSGSSSTKSHNKHSAIYPTLTYAFIPNEKLQMEISLLGVMLHTNFNNEKDTKFMPGGGVDLSWMPHQCHRIGLGIWYSLHGVDGSESNDVILQSNPLQWTKGNPKLKSYNTYVTQLRYTWIPTEESK